MKPTIYISTHAPLARCDQQILKLMPLLSDFYSRTSCEVRLYRPHHLQPPWNISTHAPLARCDQEVLCFLGYPKKISTHAPLARCDIGNYGRLISLGISTHAPLARCDSSRSMTALISSISTHAPLARCDASEASLAASPVPFLLTHLLRGATR